MKDVFSRVMLAAAIGLACTREVAKKDDTMQISQAADSTVASELPDSLLPDYRAPRYTNPDVVTDSKLTQPRIVGIEGTWVLHLPTDMARALSDSMPRLVAFEVVIGDFNRDSTADVAIYGTSDTTSALFIVLSKSKSLAQASTLFAWKTAKYPRDPDVYMSVMHPQQFPGDAELDSFTLPSDGVVLAHEGKGASVYWVAGGKIEQRVIGD